jgi:hypothetical protein
MPTKRKPKYVPPVAVDGEYAVDALFAKLFPTQATKDPTAKRFGTAYRSPPKPPPEEARPVRRRSPLAEDRPELTEKPRP